MVNRGKQGIKVELCPNDSAFRGKKVGGGKILARDTKDVRRSEGTSCNSGSRRLLRIQIGRKRPEGKKEGEDSHLKRRKEILPLKPDDEKRASACGVCRMWWNTNFGRLRRVRKGMKTEAVVRSVLKWCGIKKNRQSVCLGVSVSLAANFDPRRNGCGDLGVNKRGIKIQASPRIKARPLKVKKKKTKRSGKEPRKEGKAKSMARFWEKRDRSQIEPCQF